MTIVKKVKTVVRSIDDTFIFCVFGSLRYVVWWGVIYAIDQTTGNLFCFVWGNPG
jgi:hypothetical protein